MVGGMMMTIFLLCGTTTCASSSESGAMYQSSGIVSEQLVAMIPNGGIATGGAAMKWAHVTWDESSKDDDASGAVLKLADLTDPRVSSSLGSWAHFSAPNATAIQLTCKTDPGATTLLCLANSLESTPKKQFGCCADSLIVQRRDSRRQQVIYFVDTLRDAMVSDGIAQSDAGALLYGSHTFAIERDSRGALQMALVVEFINNETFPELGIVEMNAVAVLTLHEARSSQGDVVIASASVLKTMSGKNSFLPYRDIGSLSTDPKDLIRRVQYVPQAPASNNTSLYRQWHMNGLLRFESKSNASEPLLAFTHYGMHESVIVNDPWTHPSGMVTIRQRFGATPVYNASGELSSTLHFGVANNGQSYGQCHNVWFKAYPDGRETLTTFWNVQGSDKFSKVFEYDIALSPVCDDNSSDRQHQEGAIGISCAPTMFRTSYVHATLPFQSKQQGGARPIGNGVYISSTGAVRRGFITSAPHYHLIADDPPNPNGLHVVDVQNRSAAPVSYPEDDIPPETKFWGLYDPFAFVDLERPSVMGGDHPPNPHISTGSSSQGMQQHISKASE